MNKDILKLMAGFRRFAEKYFGKEDSLYSKLSNGQSPQTLIIGCSDSRVDPALISSAAPGELFIIRNVANLVPPFESASSGHHGISSAIEFAVVNLKVKNIVILGHRQCGGIKALMMGRQKKRESFVDKWMSIAHTAKERVEKKFKDVDFETKCRECEKEAILSSIKNLKSFPFVKKALRNKSLEIFGIYFDLERGTLMDYNKKTGKFNVINIRKLPHPQ